MSPPATSLLRRIALWIAIWAAAASIFVSQNITRYLVRGQPIDWFQAVAIELLYWVPWALLTPVLLSAAARFPLGGEETRRSIVGHIAVMIPLSLAQVIASLALQYGATVLVRQPPNGGAKLLESSLLAIPGLAITAFWKYWVFVAVYAAFESRRRLREREIRAAQLESQLATSQLAALKAQLHPHFLFNTLHAISMLNFVDAEAANRVLVQLSDLLRLTLDRSVALELPLRDEIDFIDRYLAIEQVRFEDRLDVRFEVDDAAFDALVPNLILQPLVENALRHGIGRDSTAGVLRIRARHDTASLVVEVEDDGPGLPRGWSLTRNAGIGLANVRDRLAAAYDSRGSLELCAGPTRGTIARVRMPFRHAPAAHEASTSAALAAV